MGVLVEARGEPYAVREREPGQRAPVLHARCSIDASQRRVLCACQRVERQFVRAFGIEAEEERSGKTVKRGGERQGHRIILDFVSQRILPDDFTRSRIGPEPG
jgi:hypothetical protein